MESLIKEHLDKFGVEPLVIGMFWNNQELLYGKIELAIENNNPYNEEKLLSKEELIALKSGGLVF